MLESSRSWGAVAAGLVTAVCGCGPITIPPSSAPPTPTLMKRPAGLGNQFFRGSLFPASDGAFELDVPLVTATGSVYYAFELTFRAAIGVDVELDLQPLDPSAPASVPIPELELDCGAVMPALRLQSMSSTGREGAASWSAEIDARLDAGEPLRYLSCEGGRIEGQDSVARTYGVLLPASAVGNRAELQIWGRSIVGPRSAGAGSMILVPAPHLVGVAGDSVIWGQGISPGSKHFEQLVTAIGAEVEPAGRGVRLAPILAHSGAVVHIGANAAIRTAPVAECLAGSALDGEVPRGSPSIQCQLQALAAARCETPLADRALPVPRFFCDGTAAPAEAGPTELVFIDVGPRFDYVLMDGCANDVDGVAVVVGQKGYTDLATLGAVTATECALDRWLPDLRAVLPNAAITITGYHRIVSDDSSALRACPGLPDPSLDPVAVAFATLAVLPLKQGASDRSERFQQASGTALAAAAAALDTRENGRGRVLFVPLNEVLGSGQAILAEEARVFPLSCPLLGPVDPVAAARATACAADTTATAVTHAGCLRASAFHPDTAAQTLIANRVIEALRASRLFDTPFP
jgi:hypothetical protein